MTDFEQRLKDVLNERVDEKVGPRRAPAAFRPSDTGRRPRARWLAPSVAAACVVVVAGASVGLSRVLANGGHHPASNQSSAISPKPSPSPSPGYTPSTTPAPHLVPGTHTVQVLGATLVLPDGWTVTGQRPVGDGIGPNVCIGNAHESALHCPISLSSLRPAQTEPGYGFDVDVLNLARGDLPSTLCNAGHTEAGSQGGERTVGGRPGEWRSWVYTCPAIGRTIRFDQYAVVTTPGFLLRLTVGIKAPWMVELGGAEVSTPQDVAELRSIVDAIARDSAFPAQTAPLRLFDRGIVHSMRRTGDTVTVELERVVPHVVAGREVYTTESPGKYTSYVIPAAVFDASGSIAVGSRVHLTTDGTTVVQIDEER